ncbi:hypothetical protein D7B24_006457 [Verticillium nonalfalfae]|uniref:Amine oxidase n=1 Tax=Verticillium nonalfalfae TaxID=1051616 RepID=A0A3M9YAB1_9PEZI|nr:uncharacterized protein D7B24_006457 [Verticillium nonalfalfae]RNJ57065.1 hypothetical protein D7B24_006457 [Verticillium nonalfalfae]
MASYRIQQFSRHLSANRPAKHPLDPLDAYEIENVVSIVRSQKGNAHFNTVTLHEPRKQDMLKWLAEPATAPVPMRVADVVVVDRSGQVYDVLVDLDRGIITKWEALDGVQPMIILEEMINVEHILRKDPKVIEQCRIIGIAPEDMDKVYCDPWTITHDEKYGTKVRAQQALLYYRPHIDDSQYSFPLDFYPVFDVAKKEVIDIDIPPVRRPLSLAKPNNYHIPDIEKEGGFRTDLKPINITQPEGVSFTVQNRVIRWQNWSIHVGFNYREGIVLNDINFFDKFEGKARPLFYRLSLAEMVVPYGNPDHPHHRKHAFDIGEYGAGNMTNSLALGCDCKGAIHYMDAHLPTQAGGVRSIKNAICIHEEDAGILFKHTDFRDDSTIVTRGRKLLISHIFTAANYEYCIYWVFHQDGTIQLEIKLTGILNTASINPGDDTEGYGTEVYSGVNAHNHQHLFCLRVDPNLDGQDNTVFQVDAARSPHSLGSEKNKHGNAFFAAKTKYKTVGEAQADYDGSTSRTWDISNEAKANKHSHKPVSYKLVSREVAPLMAAEGGLVWNRAGFARHAVHVTKYKDDQLYPAGRHVTQTSGIPSKGIPEWIMQNPDENIANTDIVLWHTFGITHFPAPEDYPVMPAEPITLLLRPRNFFERNPCMDIPPSYAITPSQVQQGKDGCHCAPSKESVNV